MTPQSGVSNAPFTPSDRSLFCEPSLWDMRSRRSRLVTPATLLTTRGGDRMDRPDLIEQKNQFQDFL